MSAGASTAVLGISGMVGTAAAWRRFDVDFRGCSSVRLIVHEDDLRFEPPAVARVVVATNDEVDCRVVECTETEATRMPDRYGDSPVVTYDAGTDETILGVIEYNYREDRFSEPVCLLRNDNACATNADVPDVREADCVQSGISGYWNGQLRECGFDPIDGSNSGDGPTEEPDDDDDDSPENAPVQTLSPPDGDAGDGFGAGLQVAKDGSTLLVGAPDATVDGVTSGVVYVFRAGEDGWSQTGQIVPENPTGGAQFGTAVDLSASGDTAIIGAPGAEVEGGGGAALLFAFDSSAWTQTARLVGQAFFEGEPGYSISGFGAAVAVDDAAETAVVGAPTASAFGLGSGFSIAYERDGDGWNTGTELVRIGGGDSQEFGTTVDLAAGGERAIAGAPVSFPGTTNSEGWVGVYPQDDDWDPETFLQYDEGIEGDTFGRATRCNDTCDLVLVGDPGNTDGTTPQRPGRVVSFTRSDGTWSQEAVFEAPDGIPEDLFGTALATNQEGTRALVSAPGSGAAPESYEPTVSAFERQEGNWTHVTTVGTPAGVDSESFGEAVAVDDATGRALVGLPDAAVDDVEAGAVAVFDLFG